MNTVKAVFIRLIWFTAVAAGISAVIVLVFGTVEYSAGYGDSSVVIGDEISRNQHELYGILMVANSCEQLAVRVEQFDPSFYYLDFRTWKTPYQICTKDLTPRHFKTTVVAPSAGVRFSAGLDGKPFSVIVLQRVKYRHE